MQTSRVNNSKILTIKNAKFLWYLFICELEYIGRFSKLLSCTFKVSDEELCNHFRFIISLEGLHHPPRGWERARELYKTLVNTVLFQNI